MKQADRAMENAMIKRMKRMTGMGTHICSSVASMMKWNGYKPNNLL